MKKEPMFVILAFILLVGCSSLPEGVPLDIRQTDPGWITFVRDFTFSYPQEARYRFDRSDGSVAFSTNSGASFNNRPADYTVSIVELSSASTCTFTFTGASKTAALAHTNGRAEWGRVDFFTKYDSGENYTDFDGPHPVCGNIHGNAYALCSQHNGKTIFICIAQQTDTPGLAKQIFETFRWMK